MMQREFFGLSTEVLLAGLTGLFVVAAIVLYARAIIKKKSRPHAAAWLVRLGLCVIAFASQSAQGATYSLALSGTQVVSAIVIVALCVRRDRDWQALSR